MNFGWMEIAIKYAWQRALAEGLVALCSLLTAMLFFAPFHNITAEEEIAMPTNLEELFEMSASDFYAIAMQEEGVPDELLEEMLDAAGSEDAITRLRSYAFVIILHKNKLGVSDDMVRQYAKTAHGKADTPHERRTWTDIERRLIHP